MKRILALLLAAIMMSFAFVSCGNDGNTPVETNPQATEPAATEPAATEPAATEPAATEPAATEPAATEPAATESAATEPAVTEPAATEPAATEPAATEPTIEEPVNTAVYDRVILIGVDGAGAFFSKTESPNIDAIFANGVMIQNCQSVMPSSSAPNWGAMLHGVLPEYHRLTNDIAESAKYDVESDYPSSFRVLKEAKPDAVLAAFSTWNPINHGIIEDNLGVHKETADDDAELTQKILAYLDTNAPNYMFVQFDEGDGAGHGNGYGSDEHLATLTRIDGYIGQIYTKLQEKGLLENTLFIVATDHGGTPDGDHGGDSEAELNDIFAAAGKTVVKGGQPTGMDVRDIAGIVVHAFGLKQPETWTALVPSDLFEGVVAGERSVPKPDEAVSHRLHTTEPTPAADSGKYITDFISADRFFAYLPFDGNSADVLYDSFIADEGNLKYVDGFYGQGVDVTNGNVEVEEFIPLGKSFSMGFWIKASGIPEGDPVIVSNKRWENGKNPGFVLALVNNSIKYNLGNGSARMDYDFALPTDFYTGWTYVAFSVDLDKKTVSLSLDFGKFKNVGLSDNMQNNLFVGVPGLVIGQDGSKQYGNALPAVIDDFMLLEGILTQDDIAALATYYGIEK